MKTDNPLSQKQLEAIEACQKINNELHDKFGWDNLELPIISITIASYYFFINISIGEQDIKLYNSENDERIYYEKSDRYETFYKYIKRKFLLIKEELNNIKL